MRVMKGKYERPYEEYPELKIDFQIIIQSAKKVCKFVSIRLSPFLFLFLECSSNVCDFALSEACRSHTAMSCCCAERPPDARSSGEQAARMHARFRLESKRVGAVGRRVGEQQVPSMQIKWKFKLQIAKKKQKVGLLLKMKWKAGSTDRAREQSLRRSVVATN